MKLFNLLKIMYKRIYSSLNRVEHARKIGVNFSEGLHIYGRVNWGSEPWIITLGSNVYITRNCTFITHDGGTLVFRQYVPDLEITKPITLGNNVYVGINTVFLPGVTVGNNVVIGACSVVTKDIPDNSVAAGNPARVIKSAGDYFEKIKKESLHLGHLNANEKDKALREFYGKNL